MWSAQSRDGSDRGSRGGPCRTLCGARSGLVRCWEHVLSARRRRFRSETVHADTGAGNGEAMGNGQSHGVRVASRRRDGRGLDSPTGRCSRRSHPVRSRERLRQVLGRKGLQQQILAAQIRSCVLFGDPVSTMRVTLQARKCQNTQQNIVRRL